MSHETSEIVHIVDFVVINIKLDDRIVIESSFLCRRCRRYKNKTYNLCSKMKFAVCSSDAHETLTKYFKISENFCYKISKRIRLQEIVLMKSLAIAIHTTRLMNIKLKQFVIIFEFETIKLLCATVSKTFEAKKIVAVNIMKEKLQFAKNYISDCSGRYKSVVGAYSIEYIHRKSIFWKRIYQGLSQGRHS